MTNTRRDFIRKSAMGVTAVYAGGVLSGFSAQSYNRIVGANEMLATVIIKNLSYGWRTFAETKDGTIELKSRVKDSDPDLNYTDMVEMFRTGKEPRSHDSILKCIAVLEALEQSAIHENWVEVAI